MKLPGLLIFSLCIYTASAQNDLLVLKQRKQTIKTWVAGSLIHFRFSNTQWIEGRIRAIRNDSLLLDQFVTRQAPNQFGFWITDTFRLGLMKLHVKEISGLPRSRYKSNMISNGALFQLGGSAYVFLNIVNSLYRKEQVFSSQNIVSLGIATGVIIMGKLLAWRHQPYIKLGKKYRLQIISTNNTK